MMIFCWTGCCVFLFAFVKTLQEDYSTIGLSIFLIVASLFLLWGGILKMKMGTFKLDTKEEQLERFESYLHLLKKYEHDIAFASNYKGTIANVEDDINHLKKAQFT